MTNTFSALSLKRNRSNTTKESKLNSILNKLANSFHSHHKKRKSYEKGDPINRRTSISAIFDYFRSSEDQHPFANDALFEHNRYKQQKKSNNNTCRQQTNLAPLTKSPSILVKNTNHKPPHIYHRYTQSAVTARSVAARKKKSSHIRHYSHVSCISSSNITVNSEDLTAKEFADIAGIRILSEDDVPLESQSGSKICTFCGSDETELPSLVVTSSRISYNNNSSIVRSSHSSVYNSDEEEDPQIWDTDFWQKPGNASSIETPPILHELKRDTYIKKGRFEIHLTPNTHLDPVPKNNKKQEKVVEWKRKSRPSSLKNQAIYI